MLKNVGAGLARDEVEIYRVAFIAGKPGSHKSQVAVVPCSSNHKPRHGRTQVRRQSRQVMAGGAGLV